MTHILSAVVVPRRGANGVGPKGGRGDGTHGGLSRQPAGGATIVAVAVTAVTRACGTCTRHGLVVVHGGSNGPWSAPPSARRRVPADGGSYFEVSVAALACLFSLALFLLYVPYV